MKKVNLKLFGLVAIAGLLVSAFLLPGCATLGPPFQKVEKIPDNMGLVYIYRPAKLMGGAIAYEVEANKVLVTHLPAGGYYPYFAKPGEIEFSAQTESKSAVTIDVKAGETYYIKGTIGIGFFVGRPHLIVVPREEGAKEIAECKLIPEETAKGTAKK